MANDTTATLTVKVELPELTTRLIATLKAIMAVPEQWTNEATITVGDLGAAMSKNMLPDGEHDEQICSTGLILCPECEVAR